MISKETNDKLKRLVAVIDKALLSPASYNTRNITIMVEGCTGNYTSEDFILDNREIRDIFLDHLLTTGETLTTAPSVRPPKWEYRMCSEGYAHLDELGADGWEAVAMNDKWILFKRPKQ